MFLVRFWDVSKRSRIKLCRYSDYRKGIVAFCEDIALGVGSLKRSDFSGRARLSAFHAWWGVSSRLIYAYCLAATNKIHQYITLRRKYSHAVIACTLVYDQASPFWHLGHLTIHGSVTTQRDCSRSGQFNRNGRIWCRCSVECLISCVQQYYFWSWRKGRWPFWHSSGSI